MLRRTLSVAAGLVVAMAIVFLVEGLGGIVFPAPPGMDPDNPDSVRDRMALVSAGALLFVLAAWGSARSLGRTLRGASWASRGGCGPASRALSSWPAGSRR